MNYPPEVEQAALRRVQRTEAEVSNSMKHVAAGNPLAAEPNKERLVERLQSKALLSREEAEAISVGIHAMTELSKPRREAVAGPEAIYGKTIDFVGISFLERGLNAAKSVGRVAFRDGRPQGTGFMVSDRLFLTNKHVLQSAADANSFVVEFDYELDPADKPRGPTRFSFDPAAFYLSDDVNALDYALVAVGPKLSGPRALADYSWCVLSDARDKHALGELANIVQHPDGRYKEIVLRENRLVARLDFVLHYVADTEPGSSGSPVFNNEWQVIALHHWGGPWRQQVDDGGRPLAREINEGIRVSAILQDLRGKAASIDASSRVLLDSVLDRASPPENRASDQPPSRESGVASVAADGSVTWRIPIEISVRLPHLSEPKSSPPPPSTPATPAVPSPPSSEALRPDADYSSRSGYKERFLAGFTVPMPKLSAEQREIAARNRQAEPGEDPFALPYHNFSVVMNRKRRLAFFAACNIDGSKAKHVDRKTGDVTPLEPGDPRLESLAEGAEASESWYDDERLDPSEYAGKDVYERQIVAGHPNPQSRGRTLRMFQRGHLVRRMDPAWGSNAKAKLADADTFHWTNCSPQVGFFNMGQASPSTPNSGGGKLWRAVENYVLRNAVAENTRVCSFTGPVFRNNDRRFRTIKVPKQFWKIVVWVDEGSLRAVAMLADQSKVINVWPEALDGAPENFVQPGELEQVEDFLVSVARIEELTGLDFSAAVRNADVWGQESMERVNSFDQVPLAPVSPPRARRRSDSRRAR